MFIFSRKRNVSDSTNGIALEPYLDGKASVDPVDPETAAYFMSIPGWEVIPAKDGIEDLPVQDAAPVDVEGPAPVDDAAITVEAPAEVTEPAVADPAENGEATAEKPASGKGKKVSK